MQAATHPREPAETLRQRMAAEDQAKAMATATATVKAMAMVTVGADPGMAMAADRATAMGAAIKNHRKNSLDGNRTLHSRRPGVHLSTRPGTSRGRVGEAQNLSNPYRR